AEMQIDSAETRVHSPGSPWLLRGQIQQFNGLLGLFVLQKAAGGFQAHGLVARVFNHGLIKLLEGRLGLTMHPMDFADTPVRVGRSDFFSRPFPRSRGRWRNSFPRRPTWGLCMGRGSAA